jgi:polynucleotide 5'-hydroxyl-kinase GRC3/NOL9
MTIVAETAWEELVRELCAKKGTAVLLGAVDTGKSTLARHLLRECATAGHTVALVDADIGQSSLGLPGTISMQTFRSPTEVATLRYARLSFVGAVNPARVIPLVIRETARLVRLAREAAEIVLVDTSGLVDGEIGRALKLGKIGAVAPDLVVAVERYDELRHIISRLGDTPVRHLRPAAATKPRSQPARSRLRRMRLADYLAGGSEHLLTARDAAFFVRGRQTTLRESQLREGIVIGLNHGDDTVGLGVVVESDEASVSFRTPLSFLRTVNRVIVGDFTAE